MCTKKSKLFVNIRIEDIGGAYLQFAMMYTNGNGQRKIRIINYRYHLTDKLEQIHQAADYAAFANVHYF